MPLSRQSTISNSELPTNGTASLARRLKFARDSFFFFDSLFCATPLARVARYKDWPIPRIPDHWARTAFDLVECLRTGHLVPNIGNAELAMLHGAAPIPQHSRYRSYWYDATAHAMVGMFVGVDLMQHDGRYYVIELNQGPSIYPRRRAMYDAKGDPAFLTIFALARALRFENIEAIAFRWAQPYPEELPRAGRAQGLRVALKECPLAQTPGVERIVALPDTLARDTFYIAHSGVTGPAFRFLDNKWYASHWLREELPHDSLAAVPRTSDEIFVPQPSRGERWPNLVIKLAGGARSFQVLAARFADEEDARRTLGVNGNREVPRQLRAAFVKNSLLYGRDRVLYQEFIPPTIDANGHARMIRLHVFVSPLGTSYLSAHFRISKQPVPERAPRGIIRTDDAYIFNDADYELLPPDIEDDLRHVAHELGGAMQRAIEKRFQTRAAADVPRYARDDSR